MVQASKTSQCSETTTASLVLHVTETDEPLSRTVKLEAQIPEAIEVLTGIVDTFGEPPEGPLSIYSHYDSDKVTADLFELGNALVDMMSKSNLRALRSPAVYYGTVRVGSDEFESLIVDLTGRLPARPM